MSTSVFLIRDNHTHTCQHHTCLTSNEVTELTLRPGRHGLWIQLWYFQATSWCTIYISIFGNLFESTSLMLGWSVKSHNIFDQIVIHINTPTILLGWQWVFFYVIIGNVDIMTKWIKAEVQKITSLYFNTDFKTRNRQHAPYCNKTIFKIKSHICMGATITWGTLLICNAEVAFEKWALIHLTHTENWP